MTYHPTIYADQLLARADAPKPVAPPKERKLPVPAGSLTKALLGMAAKHQRITVKSVVETRPDLSPRSVITVLARLVRSGHLVRNQSRRATRGHPVSYSRAWIEERP